MRHVRSCFAVGPVCVILAIIGGVASAQDAVLPPGVNAQWDTAKAWKETTATRQRISINGLWHWQPVDAPSEQPPADHWGFVKVPGAWPGSNGAVYEDSQQFYPAPSWKNIALSSHGWAWYQREITIPETWTGRRIVFQADYVNASATVFLDGQRAGEIKSRGGEIDLSALAAPGRKQVLSVLVRGTASPADLCGLCGDVFLESAPKAERIDDLKIDTSVRRSQLSADVALVSLDPNARYSLRADILDKGAVVKTLRSGSLRAKDLQNGRFVFNSFWSTRKLWDINAPQNLFDLKLSLLDASGKVLDEFRIVRFGFREFVIDGRDFRLNGTRVLCFAAPLEAAQVGAYAASYEGARKMLSRLKGVGVNLVYIGGDSCRPGLHVSFAEVLKAADDVGMLVAFTQPNFKDYSWDAPGSDSSNGYAADAECYVRRAQNHPSVVMYATSHRAAGLAQDANPDRLDGSYVPWPDPKDKRKRIDPNAVLALRAESIIRRFDQSHPVFHYACGNLGQMLSLSYRLGFVPMQERSDWFARWSSKGSKPLLLVEYGEPSARSWLSGRSAGEGAPTQFLLPEWGAQSRGDEAYRLTEAEKINIRAESVVWRAARQDPAQNYPARTVPLDSPNLAGAQASFIAANWPVFRVLNVPMFNRWELATAWHARPGAVNPPCRVDWDDLQRPGFSPDFIRSTRWDLAYRDSDWIANDVGRALIRWNNPLLACITGPSNNVGALDHNYQARQALHKDIVLLNNSRDTVSCALKLSTGGDNPFEYNTGGTIRAGEQWHFALNFTLPGDLKPGRYEPNITARFSSGDVQTASFAVNVLPETPKPRVSANVAVFDPDGDTRKLLSRLGVRYKSVQANSDLAPFDVLVIGRHAIALGNAIPDLSRVTRGLKVIVFEQTSDALQLRLGFRTQEYGLRRMFPRVPDHPALAGLSPELLCNWRGAGTNVPARLDVPMNDPGKFPVRRWCGFPIEFLWRCGCQGSVASVLIEKPASGDFLPIVDGGFALQYAGLLEYHEGSGLVLFCQMDVTARTDEDPAGALLASNILGYVSSWRPTLERKLRYVGDAAGKVHLQAAGFKPQPNDSSTLLAVDVLAVGPGGAQELAPHADLIREWLKAGGRLVAVGLDANEADSFLPLRLATSQSEYISGEVPPQDLRSPFAGIAPADVLNRDPRELPLVSGGAVVVAGGALAHARPIGSGDVAFCQLVPWQFDYQNSNNLKSTFRRSSFVLTRVLANMGVRPATSLLANMQTPLPSSACLDDVPDAIWLQSDDNPAHQPGSDLILPKFWRGFPVGAAEPPQDWVTVGYNDSKWRKIAVPGVWKGRFSDLASFDGPFLYRLTFDVSPDMAAKSVTLVLGVVADEDWTYVNGALVGSVTRKTNPDNFRDLPRSYKLPAGLLKPGKNVLAVKVNSLQGLGGLKGSLLVRRGFGASRWLSGFYLDKPEPLDNPYRLNPW